LQRRIQAFLEVNFWTSMGIFYPKMAAQCRPLFTYYPTMVMVGFDFTNFSRKAAMAFKSTIKKPVGIHTTPWVIMGAALILFVVVLTLAVQNINREKRYMTRFLLEKGMAIISAVEAGTRTGMMDMMWGSSQVQALLEETARLPSVLFMAIINENGLILAHSEKKKIGQNFSGPIQGDKIEPAMTARWQVTGTESGRRIFEVYRYFEPLTHANSLMRKKMGLMMKRHRMMMAPGKSGHFLSGDPAAGKPVILVGLDMAPFEAARQEDIRNTVIISSVLLLLGIGGFFSVIYAQIYRATRRSLQDTSAFADEVVTNLPVGLIATDRKGRIAFFNPTAEKITGLHFESVHGKDADQVLPQHWCGLEQSLRQGQAVVEQEMECNFGGRSVPVSVSASRIINEENEFVGKILILRDLGEVRKLQEEVRRREKLAALGRLAGGVAHEIRNPLSSIKGLATYFGGKFPDSSEDKKAAAVMVREVDRLNRVVSELLELARPSELKPRPTDINELLAHSMRLVQQDAEAKNIKLDLVTADHLPLIFADPDRISQCLLNLYLNAIQAMGAGGRLSVKSLPADRGSIRIEIADTGAGINTVDLKKIFDPYFTTKSAGTGLGLAIVHKIIEAHRGEIKVKSAPGKGTVFSILLPLAGGSDEAG